MFNDIRIVKDFNVVFFEMSKNCWLLYLALGDIKSQRRWFVILAREEDCIGEEDRVVLNVITSHVHYPINVI